MRERALKVCSFGPDDGATVVLFGDSHAGRWFPALQAAFDGKPVRLISLTKSGCRSLESASLWAPVPHYVAAVPSPKASLALIRRMETLLGVSLDLSGLEEASVEYERRLDEAVAAEPEVRALVERLEQQLDESDIPFGDLPSGDSIAREFQRFLRDQPNEES